MALVGLVINFLCLFFLSCVGLGDESAFRQNLTAPALEEGIASRRSSVREFEFIRQTGAEMGLRIWLFGGTAAGYAHYVKWDLLRKKGDGRYQSDRFDYDFTNIYRSTQDLDIVADGTVEEIQALQQKLAAKYPHFLGSKARWEVRSLRYSRGSPGEPGYKEALLDDFDFNNQNTDSNSTGMVEITESTEPVVRDLRDWKAKRCLFFEDVLSGTLHFYRSPRHRETARYKAGENPEIFSVIRALTKAFQYELALTPSNLQKMRAIVDKFDPAALDHPNAVRRLEEMGVKLIKHAVNIEYAWNTLEAIGLRQKLMVFDNSHQMESLAWWINKRPLFTKPLGARKPDGSLGKTARELFQERQWGDLVVAHETRDFLSYESITRAHTGDPNVLESRAGFAGESAVHGDGFYTQVGRFGAAGTGFTIRFRVDPEAREGSDFIVHESFLIFLNKKAIRVIPESLALTPLQYFKLVTRWRQRGDSAADSGDLGETDKGILEKFNRKLLTDVSVCNPREFRRIEAVMRRYLSTSQLNATVIGNWFAYRIRYLAARGGLSLEDYMDLMRHWKSLSVRFDSKTGIDERVLSTEAVFWGLSPKMTNVLELGYMIKDVHLRAQFAEETLKRARNSKEYLSLVVHLFGDSEPEAVFNHSQMDHEKRGLMNAVLGRTCGRFFNMNPKWDELMFMGSLSDTPELRKRIFTYASAGMVDSREKYWGIMTELFPYGASKEIDGGHLSVLAGLRPGPEDIKRLITTWEIPGALLTPMVKSVLPGMAIERAEDYTNVFASGGPSGKYHAVFAPLIASTAALFFGLNPSNEQIENVVSVLFRGNNSGSLLSSTSFFSKFILAAKTPDQVLSSLEELKSLTRRDGGYTVNIVLKKKLPQLLKLGFDGRRGKLLTGLISDESLRVTTQRKIFLQKKTIPTYLLLLDGEPKSKDRFFEATKADFKKLFPGMPDGRTILHEASRDEGYLLELAAQVARSGQEVVEFLQLARDWLFKVPRPSKARFRSVYLKHARRLLAKTTDKFQWTPEALHALKSFLDKEGMSDEMGVLQQGFPAGACGDQMLKAGGL